MIPSKAQAELDIRLLPGTEPEAFIAGIKKLLAEENINVESIKTSGASESPTDTEDFAIIKKRRQNAPLNTTIDQIVKEYGAFLE